MMQQHFNNQKKTTIEGKGVLNNRISEHILSNLSQIGIKNHLVKRLEHEGTGNKISRNYSY